MIEAYLILGVTHLAVVLWSLQRDCNKEHYAKLIDELDDDVVDTLLMGLGIVMFAGLLWPMLYVIIWNGSRKRASSAT